MRYLLIILGLLSYYFSHDLIHHIDPNTQNVIFFESGDIIFGEVVSDSIQTTKEKYFFGFKSNEISTRRLEINRPVRKGFNGISKSRTKLYLKNNPSEYQVFENINSLNIEQKEKLYKKYYKNPITLVSLNLFFPILTNAYIEFSSNSSDFKHIDKLLLASFAVGPMPYAPLGYRLKPLRHTIMQPYFCFLGILVTSIGWDWDETEELTTKGFYKSAIVPLYTYVLFTSFEILLLTMNHNDRLKKKIFGSNADNNLSFKILPTSNGAYLNLSYKF